MYDPTDPWSMSNEYSTISVHLRHLEQQGEYFKRHSEKLRQEIRETERLKAENPYRVDITPKTKYEYTKKPAEYEFSREELLQLLVIRPALILSICMVFIFIAIL